MRQQPPGPAPDGKPDFRVPGVKRLAPALAASFLARHGLADPCWVRTIAIPGDDEFPTLTLPGVKLRYSTERSYPVCLAAVIAGSPLLYVQFGSFDTAEHAARGPGWAIPGAYRARDDDERIRQVLGFDEGWEDAEFECMFACDGRLAGFWRAAAGRRRFGLTIPGAKSLYPVSLHDWDLESIAVFLDA